MVALGRYGAQAKKMLMVVILQAVRVGGDSGWCREYRGDVSNPFWGFMQAERTRSKGVQRQWHMVEVEHRRGGSPAKLWPWQPEFEHK